MSLSFSRRSIVREFIRKIEETSGQNVSLCMQCGTCAGACPMREVTDLSPRRIIHLTHLGMHDQVLAANTCWVCAACYRCEVRCPRGLDIPRIMEAVRLLTLRRNVDFIQVNEMDKGLIHELPQAAMVAELRKHTA